MFSLVQIRRDLKGASVSLQQLVEAEDIMFGQYSCFRKFQGLTAAYAGINANSNKHSIGSACQQNNFCFVLFWFCIELLRDCY